MKTKLSIIMYHYVREIPRMRYTNIKGLYCTEFKEQLEFLQYHHYHFVSMEDVIACKSDLTLLPSNPVLLTFDDGYIDHYTNVFPILDMMKIPGFFSMPGKIIREKALLDVNRVHFILASKNIEEIVGILNDKLDYYRGQEFEFPANEELYEKLAVANRFDNKDTIFVKRILQVELPEKLRNIISKELFDDVVGVKEEYFVEELYMSMDQVKMMKKHGMSWGIHGYDHYWMNRLDSYVLQQDISQALEVFDGIVPINNWTCCYPYGSVSDEVVDTIKVMGSAAGLTTEVRKVDMRADDIYKLPRLDTNDYPPKSNNYQLQQ